MCFKDACQPHWNVIIRALVFLSCSLTVFKLVKGKYGVNSLTVLGGGFVSLLVSFPVADWFPMIFLVL